MASAVKYGHTFYASSSSSASLTRYAPGSSAGRHRHDCAYVAFVLGGGFSQSARSELIASTGHLVVLPAGSWHSDAVGPAGSTCLNFSLDHGQAEALLPFAGRLGPDASAAARRIAHEIARDEIVDTFALEALICEFIGGIGTHGPLALPSGVDLLAEWIASEPLRPWRLSEAAEGGIL